MQAKGNTWFILAFSALLASGPIGCSKGEGIGERTGKALDEAAEELEKDAEEVGEAIEEGAEEVEDAVKKGAEQAEEAIEDVGE
ncbi:MAG TPA: hypothetical protein VFG08_03310 [Candidatus Polarisedimenticolia bacterium]|nr:hypothetical protein [Candidatus Polarisedimenticolia bacterium]